MIKKFIPIILYKKGIIKWKISDDGEKIKMTIIYHLQYLKFKTIEMEFNSEEEPLNQLIKASKIIIDGFHNKYELF